MPINQETPHQGAKASVGVLWTTVMATIVSTAIMGPTIDLDWATMAVPTAPVSVNSQPMAVVSAAAAASPAVRKFGGLNRRLV
jgi:hypothetical protein